MAIVFIVAIIVFFIALFWNLFTGDRPKEKTEPRINWDGVRTTYSGAREEAGDNGHVVPIGNLKTGYMYFYKKSSW